MAGRWMLFGDDESFKDQEVIRVETPPCAAKFAEAHPEIWRTLSEEERLVYKGPAACKKALAAHKREIRAIKKASNDQVVREMASRSKMPALAGPSTDPSPSLAIRHPQPRYPTNFGGSPISSTGVETAPSVPSASSAPTNEGPWAASHRVPTLPNEGPSAIRSVPKEAMSVGQATQGTPMDVSVTPASNMLTDTMSLAPSTARHQTSGTSSTGSYQRQHGQHSTSSTVRYAPVYGASYSPSTRQC
ncbi:hypothetical protein C8Q78DRAFT_16443 [Trametes maxima]|nr:hypothetical protein C8Q78DRAFT_16443 [Trametes maxima]